MVSGRILDLDPTQGAKTYRAFVRERITKNQLKLIRSAVQRNQLTGSRRFVETWPKSVGVLRTPGPGRPKNKGDTVFP